MIRYVRNTLAIGILITLLVLIIRVVYYIESEKIDNKELVTYYDNIVIIKGKKSRLKCLIDDKVIEYRTISNLEKEYNDVIGDIKVVNNKVVSIKLKPCMIKGKLLSYDGKKAEIDKYGKVKCTESLEIYGKENEGYKELTENELRVGMEDITFVLEGDKICAIIVKNESYNSKNIRVLIKTSNYSGIIHNYVEFKSRYELELLFIDDVKSVSGRVVKENIVKGKVDSVNYTVKKIAPNKIIRIKPNSKYYRKSNRILIRSKADKGVMLTSVKRATNGLKYYGQLELIKTKNGIVVVNDIDIEKYLYSVIPSEMPESYGVEALKVQAICARTYAYSQLDNNKYKKYGANIDDSISYQVYNNQKYGKDSVEAVNDTKGKVIKYNGRIANIFYYSTSCGYSSSTKDVFGGENIEYLVSKKQTYLENNIKNENNNIISKKRDIRNESNKVISKKRDIKNEKYFRNFILSTDEDCFEKNCEWFRWKIIWNVDKITSAINHNIRDVCSKGKNSNVTVYDKKQKKYMCKKIDGVGKVKNIKVCKRGSGGVVTQIIIYGTERKIKLDTQYIIRKIIGPYNTSIIKNNKVKVNNMDMLPSSYFIIDKKENKYVITGGGYGHGIGMSQCGVNELIKLGKSYDEVLKYYFNNTSIEYY